MNKKIDFNNDIELSLYAQEEVNKLSNELLHLKENIKLFGEYDKEDIRYIREDETELKSLIFNGKKQFYDYLVSSIMKIDENSKEELKLLKSRIELFNDRIDYLLGILEQSEEEIWGIISSISKHWRVK